ncbi:beta-lactamase family protein [Roseomonas sp. HJA6]|uniref:Beta-lactamase family protein n=1 Tax=Roseomonas alba TaxID=2846776 RepID=A0ABS7A288_9PROT|nr:serine hydrolase domain-containing protein [Neoroseomonas alba]MBW6396427.1 beta-lactamase family protein [Neoroseomonas alba]
MAELDWKAACRAADALCAAWPDDTPGGTILIFDRNGMRGTAQGGCASLVHGLPFTPDTPTRFASITKHVFCAFALNQGLDMQAPLGALHPGLPAAFADVPAFRALSMTGGLPDLMQSYVICATPSSAMLDVAALDAFTLTLPGLDNPPGVEMSYSNTGYRVMEQALAARGAVFRDWVEVTLNSALGTRFVFPAGWDSVVPGLADGYWREAGGPWRIGGYGMALSASGALTGSARDLSVWLAALLRGEGPAGGLLDRMATPVTLTDGRAVDYGLGLAHCRLGGRPLLGHGGHLTGFKNHFLVDREAGWGVIALSNREETDPFLLALRVAAALTGATLRDPAPNLLPEGFFVEADGPCWIEHRAGALTFLGAREMLYAGDAPGEAVSLSPYLPIRLQRDGDAIAGEIGHVARRFLPVRTDAALSSGFAGTWRAAAQHATLTVTPDGMVEAGGGALFRRAALMPLDATRALMPVGALPWPGRACAWLHAPDMLRLVTNRSRVLDFTRA